MASQKPAQSFARYFAFVYVRDMPRRKLSVALKAAIADLSDAEKNKLLFRLIPSNSNLVDRLEYELLEMGATQEERRDEMKARIDDGLEHAEHTYYSPGYFLVDLRTLSGEITRHVQATRDKYGDIALNLQLLTGALSRCGKRMLEHPPRKSETLRNYIVRRSLKLIRLLDKMHEDLRMDFQPEMEALADLIAENRYLLFTAEHLGLEVGKLQEEWGSV